MEEVEPWAPDFGFRGGHERMDNKDTGSRKQRLVKSLLASAFL